MQSSGQCILSCFPIRSKPESTSEIVTQALYGNTYTVLEKSNDWCKIKLDLDGYEGWMSANQYHSVTSENSTFQKEFPFILKNGIFIPQGSEVNQTIGSISTQTSLLEAAREWLGVPYLWGGKTFLGVDCSGFVQIIFQVTLNRVLPRDASQQYKMGVEVSWTDREEGDLAFFKNESNRITHVGILTDKDHIIHASGRVREDVLDEQGICRKTKYTHNLAGLRRVV